MISSVLLVMLNGMLGITALLVGTIGTLYRKRYEADLPVPHCKNILGICNGEQQITGEQKRRKRLQNSHENFCYL